MFVRKTFPLRQVVMYRVQIKAAGWAPKQHEEVLENRDDRGHRAYIQHPYLWSIFSKQAPGIGWDWGICRFLRTSFLHYTVAIIAVDLRRIFDMTLNQIQQNLANVPEGTDCFPGDITIPFLRQIPGLRQFSNTTIMVAPRLGAQLERVVAPCLWYSPSTIDPLKFQIRCRRSVGGQNCSPTGSSKPSNENSANRLGEKVMLEKRSVR